MRKTKLLILAIMCAFVCLACALVACSTTHVHTIALVDEVEATCTEQGTESHYKCTGCGKLFADADGVNEITSDDLEHTEALGHTGGTATCTEQAVCVRCDQPYGELGEHDFSGGWVTDEEGHYLGCVNCGAIKEGETKIAHTYANKIVADRFIKSAANCTYGTEYYMTCECGAFDENAESGFYFGKIDATAHDVGECYDATHHWIGCRIQGCTTKAKERMAEHDISRAYVKTASSHYQTCSGCSIHANEAEHDYSEHAEKTEFVITAPTCQRKGEYHVSCVCGDFEANGEKFQTATVGDHDWHYTVTETQHSATCPNCTNTIALADHSFNSVATLKNAAKVYNEDDVITIADLAIEGACACGKKATASGSVESDFSYTVLGIENESFYVEVDGNNTKIDINSRKLAKWNITLVGATVGGSMSFQTKATKTIGELVTATGRTFAGFYYDQDFNVYYTGTLPADYVDENVTAYNLATYKLPDNEAGATKELILTAMFLEDMAHFAPSNSGTSKVGDHVDIDGVIATKFDFTAAAEYTVSSVRDTATHSVNVTAPANGKSLMLMYIKNNGSTAATVTYKTEGENGGEMTVTVPASTTVTVPFAYGVDGANFATCNHVISATGAASLGIYGYIVVDGGLKVKDFELTSGVEYETGKPISIDGTLTVGDDDHTYTIDVYGINTNLPEGAMIEQGYHHVTLDAFGRSDSLTIYKKDERSGWNRVTFGREQGWTSTVDFTGELITINGGTATKYTLPKTVSTGFMALNTNSINQSGTVNSRIPLYTGEARELELHFINYTDNEFKINVNPENEGAGQVLTIAGGKSGEEQVFNVTWKANHGKSTPGGWLNANICSEVKAGTSFALYGYWKATNTDRSKEMKIIGNPTKTSFKVGDKFNSTGLHMKLNTHSDNNDQARILNYVTDYDDYTFTANDVGTKTVTVYWSGVTTTYEITVTA